MSHTIGNAWKKRENGLDKITAENTKIPEMYQQMKENTPKVRLEVYKANDKMKSDLCVSERQAKGTMVIVGNKLFDRKWETAERMRG